MNFNENKYIGIFKNMYNSTYAINNTYMYTMNLQNTEDIKEMMKERDVLNTF